jgi:hypothetical protein
MESIKIKLVNLWKYNVDKDLDKNNNKDEDKNEYKN